MAALYRSLIRYADSKIPAKFLPAWNHAAGPKTVFFWAPWMKQFVHGNTQVPQLLVLGIVDHRFSRESYCFVSAQALVGAGLGDINRPAEKLSLSQSSALAITGCIWSRYSFVIYPVNINLFLVNMFVGCTGFYQLARIYMYEQEKKKIAAK